MHMELPKDIVVGDQLVITPKSLVCSRYGDFIDSCGFYNEMVRSHFNSFHEFRGLLSICVRDFVFVGSSKCALKQVPKKMASIHLRRTDKVREGKDIDKHMIGTHELDGLNKITKDWIVDAAKTHNHFYICGDDDAAVSEYKDFVVGNRLSLFDPTVGDIDSWERTYIDLAVMSASKTIFQSQRNSSFSRFAAMLRGAKMINAYEGDKICI